MVFKRKKDKKKISIKKMKDIVCIFEINGKHIDVLLKEKYNNKVKINKNARPLPENSYYISNIKGLVDSVPKDIPIKTFLMDRDLPVNLTFNKPKPPDYTSKTLDLLIESNIFEGILKGMSVTKMQALLYGSLGIVFYLAVQSFLTIVG